MVSSGNFYFIDQCLFVWKIKIWIYSFTWATIAGEEVFVTWVIT